MDQIKSLLSHSVLLFFLIIIFLFSLAKQAAAVGSCSQYGEVNTEFRQSGDAQRPWQSGSSLGTLPPNTAIDVNCFAKTGTAVIDDAKITVQYPDSTSHTWTATSLTSFYVTQPGTYTFRCQSQKHSSCSDADAVQVAKPETTPAPTAKPTQQCSDIYLSSMGGTSKYDFSKSTQNWLGNLDATFSCRLKSNDQNAGPWVVAVYKGEITDVNKYLAKTAFNQTALTPTISTPPEQDSYYTVACAQTNGADNNMNAPLTGTVCDATIINPARTGGWFWPIRRSPTPTPTATGTPTPSPSASPKPSATPKPTATPIPGYPTCTDLEVVGGNESIIPAKVTLRARANEDKGQVQKYRFYFGDGKQEETTNPEIQHSYEVSGTFRARVDIQDAQGRWHNSSACETSVRVKPSPIESHKASCSDIFVTLDNNGVAPATAKFTLTGYDNKGSIQAYRIEYGNGKTEEKSSPDFSHYYDKAGTYTVKASIKDSQGNWTSGDQNCRKTIYINTEKLSTQPTTGTPTALSIFGLTSGVGSSLLYYLRKRLVA